MCKIILIAEILLVVWVFFVEPNMLVVKNYRVNSLRGIRVVYASDFHIPEFGKRRLEKVVNLINKQNPDLVLLGGDYINGYSGKHTLPINEQADILKRIKAPAVSVPGNHDCVYGWDRVRLALENAGIVVLSNSNVKIKGIDIAGVDDLKTGVPDVEKALADTSSPRILLTHSPDIYYDVKADVDLILAGHTHGGQVSFPIIGAPIVPSKYGSKFARGVIKETQNTMIITKGIGTSILPIRFCSVPEIIVIN